MLQEISYIVDTVQPYSCTVVCTSRHTTVTYTVDGIDGLYRQCAVCSPPHPNLSE